MKNEVRSRAGSVGYLPCSILAVLVFTASPANSQAANTDFAATIGAKPHEGLGLLSGEVNKVTVTGPADQPGAPFDATLARSDEWTACDDTDTKAVDPTIVTWGFNSATITQTPQPAQGTSTTGPLAQGDWVVVNTCTTATAFGVVSVSAEFDRSNPRASAYYKRLQGFLVHVLGVRHDFDDHGAEVPTPPQFLGDVKEDAILTAAEKAGIGSSTIGQLDISGAFKTYRASRAGKISTWGVGASGDFLFPNFGVDFGAGYAMNFRSVSLKNWSDAVGSTYDLHVGLAAGFRDRYIGFVGAAGGGADRLAGRYQDDMALTGAWYLYSLFALDLNFHKAFRTQLGGQFIWRTKDTFESRWHVALAIGYEDLDTHGVHKDGYVQFLIKGFLDEYPGLNAHGLGIGLGPRFVF